MQVAKHTVVSIDYTLKDSDGTVLDSSEGRDPLEYLHGVGGIIPGLENALVGKTPGDAMELTIPPGEGYGERNESLMQDVARGQFEGVDDLQPGMQFRVPSNAGPVVVTIVKIDGDTVTLDGNHALAGVTLNFDVTVRDVRDATEEEISHGHVHGPGGHDHG